MSLQTEFSDKICRICLNEGKISIYNSDYSQSRLCDKICIFGDIEVLEEDIFPKHLCQSCFSALQQAIHFRRTAKETDRLLKLKTQTTKNFQVILNGSRCAKNEKQIVYLQNYSQTQMKKKKLESAPIQNGKLTISHSKSKKMQSTTVDISKDSETDEEILGTDDIQADFESYELESTIDIKGDSKQNVNKEHISKMKQIKYEQECGLETVKSRVLSPISEKILVKITNMTRFQCEICYESFRDRNAYYEHRKLVHSSGQDVSSNCSNKVFQISSNHSGKLMHDLKDPLDLYAKHFNYIGLINNKPMVHCQICDKTIQKASIPVHCKVQHEINSPSFYLCDAYITQIKGRGIYFMLNLFCGRKCNSRSKLVEHKTTHTNDFLFQCKLCPYKGRNNGLLSMHMRIHSEKYFICDLCSKQFKHKSNLTRHIRRHYKPEYKCKVCKRQFYENSGLSRHFKTKHIEVNKPIPCELCDKEYSCRNNLLNHQFKVHGRKKVGLGDLAHYLKQQN